MIEEKKGGVGVGSGLAKMGRKRGPNKESIGVLQQVLEIMQASCGFLAGLDLALSQFCEPFLWS